MSTFQVGINRQIVGKCDPQKLSYAGAWQNASVAFAELAEHIGQGHPWMPALLNGNRKRWQNNANHAEVLALDIDEGMLIQSSITHPFIRQHCSLGIESASSTEQHNKFRLVFRLPHSVEGWENIRICNRYLGHIVGAADPACKDASRYFFGAPGRKPFLLNESASLPEIFIDDAIAWHEAIEAEEKRRAEIARQQWETWKTQCSEQDAESLILSALDAIPPDCDYNDWIAIGMALSGMGDLWFSAWDNWSASGASYKPGECDRKWRSFKSKKPAPEVVFGIAKRYGFKFPKTEKADFQPAAPIYSPEYVEAMSAEAAEWEAQQQQIEVAIADEEKAQLVAHLETKRQSALRTEVKPNAAAAAIKVRAKVNDDVAVVSSHEEGIRIGLELGKRVLGNNSGTGRGKSEGDAQMTVEMLKAMGIDVNRKISVLPDPLNPPNPIYEEHYTLVPGRHLGTYTDPESGKKRRVKDDTAAIPFEPANCKFAGTPIFSPQLQCMACSHRHRCGTERGDGYGARFEAHEALRYPNNIMSVGRLPHPGTEDMNLLTEAWLTIDEAPQVVEIAKTTHVEPIDIHRKEDQLEKESPEIAAQFKPLLDYLKAAQWQQSSDFNPVHGVPLAAVRNELLDTLWDLIPADENGLIWIGDPADIPINWDELYDAEDTYLEQQRLIFGDKAEKLTQTECNRLQRLKKKQVPNPENDRQWRVLEAKLEQAGKLNQDDRKALNLYRSNYLSQDEEYELAELSERHEATKFQPPSPAELRNKSAQVTKPWLHDCLQVVTGTVPGNITFNADGSFDIAIKNEHHTGAIAAAKYVELMSADLPRTNAAVAQQFGCDADEVFLFEVNPAKANGLSDGDKPNNLKVVQVASLGAMGRQRGATYETAKQNLVAELEKRNPGKHRHYDLKGFQRHKTHFIENSSDNEPFEAGVTTISMTGPRPSMKGVLSTYCTLTGQIVGFDDPGYQEYYQEQFRKLIDQTEGRFRRQWRPEEQFVLYIFSDEELPIQVDEVISASTITEDAAVGKERLFCQLPRAIAGIAIEGGKLTQQAIAAALGCTQARVSQLVSAIPGGWKIFKAIFCKLFGSIQHCPDGNINSLIEETREIYKTEIPPAELDDFYAFLTAVIEMYREGTYSAEEVVKEFFKIALNIGSKLWRSVTASMPSELRSQLQSIVLEAYPKFPKWLGVPE